MRQTNDLFRRGATACFFLLAVSGCGSTEKSEVADAAYLVTPQATKLSSGSLMPNAIGGSWQLKGTVETSETRNPAQLIITSEKSQTMGSETGTLFTTRFNGKVIRSELIASDDRNVRWLGGANKAGVLMTFDPPIPRLTLPLAAPTVVPEWHGHLFVQNKSIPGSALCRMSGPDYIKTPAGEFQAFRSDVKLIVEPGPKETVIYSTLWFAPGVGIVKEAFLQNGDGVFVELKKYTPAPH